jgi:hypothetical protein
VTLRSGAVHAAMTRFAGMIAAAAILVAPWTAGTASARMLLALTGASPGDNFGGAVAGGGDVNGDGFDDLVVGAYQSDFGGLDAGQAYLFFGGSRPDSRPDLVLTGEAPGDLFGVAVAIVGDVNKDGYADILVGAYGNDARGANAGRAYLYFGGPRPDGRPDVVLSGEAAGDAFGYSVAGAGDVNRDGYADFMVGAYENSARGAAAGRVYVYYGGPHPDDRPDLVLNGEAPGDLFGISVASAGDVNGDGASDLIVGAYQNDAGGQDAGRAYIFFGGPYVDDRPDLVLTGAAAGDYFGFSVASAGDFNHDGFSDVIVGAYHNDAGGAEAGRAYVYFGDPHPDATPDLTLTGEAAGDAFGYGVAGAGDLNGDGFADVVVGAYGNDAGGSAAGRAYVYYGGKAPDTLPDFTVTGEATLDNLGYAVSSAGNLQGEGIADLVVAAPFANAGSVYVVKPTSGRVKPVARR